LVGTALTLTALSTFNSYRATALGSARWTLASITGVMGLAFLAALTTYFLVPLPVGATPALVHTAGFYFGMLLLARSALRGVSRSRLFRRRVIVIGAGDLGVAIARALRPWSNVGIELIGFLSDEDDLQGEYVEGLRVLGKAHHLEKIVRRTKVDRVVVASQNRSESFPADQLLDAKLSGCRVDSGVEFYEALTGQLWVRGLRPSYLIFSRAAGLGSGPCHLQRAFDVVVSSMALIASAPVLGLCAVAIRMDSPGPALFSQTRIGRSGRCFRCVKLRSMRVGAEDETGPVFTSRRDERITRVGRILRQTRLDEIPQFWNVLGGDMSIVGPRPERPEFEEVLSAAHPYFRWRSAVRPGVTGWAQVQYGYVNGVEEFEQKLALDLFYLKYRSLAMDLIILWRTVKTVVLVQGV
jgi:exopolysaccharide biosynthesis polyprenyl glycosylphosphotransferase